MAKVLTDIVDKNGKHTRVWKGAQQSAAAPFVASPDSASVPTGLLPSTVVVRNSHNEEVVLSTTEFGWDAEQVYAEGQCAAFAVALADEFPDAVIKTATDRDGTMLVHAWLEENGFVFDARSFGDADAEEFVDEMAMQWGAVEVAEHTPESLRAWIESENPNAKQGWDEASYMVPAWLEKHYS